MKTTEQYLFFIAPLFAALLIPAARAASPSIDTFNVQSYIRLTNGQATSATSGTFVFGVFKGSTCIWAKRYSSVSINTGVISQNLSGVGTNITSISNPSATPGECVSNFSSTTLNSTLLNSGASNGLNLRVYAETSLDGFQPVWDVAFVTVPTAMVADTANSATTAATASDLASGMKVSVSPGASAVGKFPVLDSSGKIDNSMINQSGLTISNSQVSGLGTAALVNTGSAMGNVPLLSTGGLLPATMMPNTYTANRILATNGSGVISGSYATTTASAGAGDIGKIPLLNASGKVDNTAIDSTALTPNPANLSAAVPVNKGGTGNTALTANNLLVGNGTSAVTFLAPTNGNVIYGAAGAWTSGTPDSADLVDKTNAQTIAGNKTFSGNTVLNGTVKFGSAGSTLTNIIYCSIAAGGNLTSGTVRTGTCTGATTAGVAQCSPSTAPAAGWLIASVRVSAANTIEYMPIRWTGATNWNPAMKCVVFNP